MSTGLGSSESTGKPGDERGGEGETEPVSKLDLGGVLDAPPQPLPPGICPPDCQFELSLDWSYDGLVGQPPAVPEPGDRVLLIVDNGDRVTVAEQRQGAITVIHIDPTGQEQWVLPLALPCDPCRMAAFEMDSFGRVLLSGDGVDPTGAPIAFVAHVVLAGPSLAWAQAAPLVQTPGVTPRAGGVAELDGELMVQPVIQGSPVEGRERLALFFYDRQTGAFGYADTIANDLGTTGAMDPRAVHYDDGLIVIGYPSGRIPTLDGSLGWVEAIGGTFLGTQSFPTPALGLVRAIEDRVLALGQTPGVGDTTLYLHSSTAWLPTEWSTTHVVATDSAPMPSLTSGMGPAYVATRVATGAPGRETSTGIHLLRWSDKGELTWQVTLPTQTDPVDAPVSLKLRNNVDLVLGSFVDGAPHVEQRRQTCTCD